jgi:hypothetical protein
MMTIGDLRFSATELTFFPPFLSVVRVLVTAFAHIMRATIEKSWRTPQLFESDPSECDDDRIIL